MARLSSRTSNAGSPVRRAHSVVVPGRSPATDPNPLADPGRAGSRGCPPARRPRAANTPQAGPGRPGRPGVNRIARFLSSSGYFPGAGMILILPWIQTLHHTRGDPVCAERNVQIRLGVPDNQVHFTEAVRPRFVQDVAKGKPVPQGVNVNICTTCQHDFERWQFPRGTKPDPGGDWGE